MAAKSVTSEAYLSETPDDAPNLAAASGPIIDAKTLAYQKELLQVVLNHFLTSAAI